MNGTSSDSARPRAPRNSAWLITLTYISVSIVWIILSDLAVLGIGSAADRPILTVSLIKGLFWVTSSGLLLHLIVFKQLERVRAYEASARARLVEAETIGRFGASESYGDSRPAWSDGMYRLWGRAPEDGAPDAAWVEERIDARDLDRARRAAEAAVRGETPHPYDLRVRGGDGVDRVLRITSRSESERGLLRTLTVAQDVSELRALEHHATESLRLLRSILESTAEGILVVRSDTREILLWNERFADLTRTSRSVLERLDARVSFDSFSEHLCNEADVRSRIEEIYRTGHTADVAIVELKDGTILEEYTAPVEFEHSFEARIWSYRDVTERARARETLERRERQLAHAQSIASLGSFEWDLETLEVSWSEEVLGIFGLDPATPNEMDVARRLTLPADLPAVDAAIALARARRKMEATRFRIVRPDGELRVVEARGEPQASGGELRYFIGSVQDVTEEYESRRALAEAEERFRATFDQAAVGIAHLSLDRVILRVNKTLCNGIGHAREDLIGSPADALVHPGDLPEAQERFARVVEGKSAFQTWEMRCLTQSGTAVWIEATVSAARLAGGDTYLIAVAQDITARKALEAEREALARQVRLLLRSTEAGLLTVDLDGRCTLINRAACNLLGYFERELLGRKMEEILYGSEANVPDQANLSIVQANRGSSTKLYNHRYRKRDGSILPVDVAVSPVIEDGIVIGRAVSFVDVSDRMRLEEQLEEARRLSGLGRVAASIAHEINNVLMGILPFAEIVSRSGEPLFRNAAERIRQSVQRGRGVTQEILRFAREEEPARQIFEGGAWLESAGAELQELTGRVSLSMAIPAEAFYLDADASQLSQVLINLVMNARDAVDPAEGKIEIVVELVEPGTRFPFGALPSLEGRWAAIRVTDNGSGMDSKTLEHLFEPFFTKKRGGTGLGLPIAYRIVAAHGGLFFVQSAEGKGSTFFIFLPESLPPATPAPPKTDGSLKLSGTVLLVEDDETVAAGLAVILEDAGMRLRIASTGRDALAELDRSRPDVMILDVGLPDMQGGEVCERALARWPGLPVIFSTGHGEASALSAFLVNANVRFLMKPYSFEQLREAMESAMSG